MNRIILPKKFLQRLFPSFFVERVLMIASHFEKGKKFPCSPNLEALMVHANNN
jgi:hypothetical protein